MLPANGNLTGAGKVGRWSAIAVGGIRTRTCSKQHRYEAVPHNRHAPPHAPPDHHSNHGRVPPGAQLKPAVKDATACQWRRPRRPAAVTHQPRHAIVEKRPRSTTAASGISGRGRRRRQTHPAPKHQHQCPQIPQRGAAPAWSATTPGPPRARRSATTASKRPLQ